MKKKLNALDIFFIAVVVIAVAAIGLRFASSKTERATHPVSLEVTVRVDNIRQCSVNSIQKSEAFYDKDLFFGKVKEVVVEPFVDNIEMMNGKLIPAENPEKYTAYITLDVETVQNAQNYFTPKLRTFAVGSSLSLESKYIAFESRVQSIQPME